MKILIIRIVLLSALIVFSLANISILSHTYIYSESVENLYPKIKFWAKNAEYKLNYFGTTSEMKLNGKKSLKMDITIMGNGAKECYYYWIIPVRIKHFGEIIQSANVWADSNASKFLSVGLNFVYPPDSIKRGIVIQSNKWQKILDTLPGHRAESSQLSSLSNLQDNYSEGNELNRIGIFIRAKGQHRMVFYLNDIILQGKTYNISDFQKYLKYKWKSFKTRYNISLNSLFLPKTDFAISNVTESSLSLAGINLFKQSELDKEKIISLYNEIENSRRLKFEEINQFRDLVQSWSGKVELIKSDLREPKAKVAAFYLPATRFNRLNGTNLPEDVKPLEKLSSRVCSDQYESFSILLQPKEPLKDIKLKWGDFKGSEGTIKSSALDVSIAKVWYQAGVRSTEVNNKLLTQELLLKDDNLIKVDFNTQTNYLWVKDKDGNGKYIDISTPSAKFPDDVYVSDSRTLQAFSIEENTNKQLWFTLHVPPDAKPGKYRTQVVLTDNQGKLLEFPFEFQVLPFRLDQSRLVYSLYYHGALRTWKLRAFHCEDKTPGQLETELRDMKEHGVLYPNNYQDEKNLAANLEIRNKVGLPKDKLYSTLLDWCTSLPKSQEELEKFKARIKRFKDIAESKGYRDLYIYGIDEARGEKLLSEKPAWKAAHEMGVKIFASGYYETFADAGELLDLGIIQGPLTKEQSALYHSAGHQVFSYSNPQVGQENPEIYRRNYGLALWKAGYDGSMDYAYQKNYGSIWNDFDNPRYREETFTYPTSDGIISTIQWEGYRQGVNDVRFLSTLLNKLDKLKASGKKTAELEKWINSIDPAQDLDELRNKIIDKILSIAYL